MERHRRRAPRPQDHPPPQEGGGQPLPPQVRKGGVQKIQVQKGGVPPVIESYLDGDKVFANSLGIKYPDIASEISSDNPRFGKIRNLPAKSSVKVKWLCSRCGMEWTASITSRTRAGSGCPYCAGLRPIPGRTDLATLHPDIASKLCDGLNDGVKADQVTAGSQKILWWNCCRCGKKWKASQYMRCRGQKCPRCRRIPSSASKPIKSSKISSNNASLDDFY